MRPPAVVFVLLVSLAALPTVVALQPDVGARITIAADGSVEEIGGDGWLRRLDNATPRSEYAWEVDLSSSYAIVELRAAPRAFDAAQGRQVLPLLLIDRADPTCARAETRWLCDYPLFTMLHTVDPTDVDEPARVVNVTATDDGTTLLLGIPGPVRATLIVKADVTAPVVTSIGEVSNLTHYSFLRSTRTDELALGDLQVRRQGAQEWVQNPTPQYHYLQHFPVQGLEAERDHETRLVVVDWSGNERVIPLPDVRTLAAPVAEVATIRPVSPAPDSTVEATGVVVRAEIRQAAPLAQDDVRLFFDLKEVAEGYTIVNGNLTFTPPSPLEPGRYTVSIEVTNDVGGRAREVWRFDVAGAARDTPQSTLVAVAAFGLATIALTRRR